MGTRAGILGFGDIFSLMDGMMLPVVVVGRKIIAGERGGADGGWQYAGGKGPGHRGGGVHRIPCG